MSSPAHGICNYFENIIYDHVMVSIDPVITLIFLIFSSVTDNDLTSESDISDTQWKFFQLNFFLKISQKILNL